VKRVAPLILYALMGWYLLVPPYDCPNLSAGVKGCVRINEPMSQWRFTPFESLSECQDSLRYSQTHLWHFAETSHVNLKDPISLEAVLITNRGYLEAFCIASDDPRLKP
jgi:hypothetical protein